MLSEWSHLHNGINIANRQIDKNRFCTNTTIDPISFCSVCYFPFCSKFGASPIVRSQTFFHYVIVAVLLFCQRFILYIYTSIPTAIKLNRKEKKKIVIHLALAEMGKNVYFFISCLYMHMHDIWMRISS